MINKRLINMSPESLGHIQKIVACQLSSTLANVALIFTIGTQVNQIYQGESPNILMTAMVFLSVIGLRCILKQTIAKNAFLASTNVKVTLRKAIYRKILELGGRYTKNLSTAEVIQVSSEGVDQLEIYFSSYLPQFFYCMLSPLMMFLILSPISFKAAFALFVCVPFIPISIMVIQKIAKKLLAKYWGLYASLGDNFLENVQGMTTLKIYQADETYHKEMNESAEHFRNITMKVLSMQLNSIIIMDLVAYGGTSLGIILAILELQNGNMNIGQAIIITLLASEFFLPMRLLGSFFHIAMNGMAASEKMFTILDLEVAETGTTKLEKDVDTVTFENVSFRYEADTKQILKEISFEAGIGMTSIVGVSGSGKSTISSLLCSQYEIEAGHISVGGVDLKLVEQKSLYETITRVTDKGYLFYGTVKSNLLMANPNATQQDMIEALRKANIWALFADKEGLDTKIEERGSNLSGGERQRVNIARALLKDSPVYIFDEVTSNIDVESEDDIIRLILELSKTKVVLFISHRLQNVVHSKQILMLQEGIMLEKGTHEELLQTKGFYANLFQTQQQLEQYRKVEA